MIAYLDRALFCFKLKVSTILQHSLLHFIICACMCDRSVGPDYPPYCVAKKHNRRRPLWCKHSCCSYINRTGDPNLSEWLFSDYWITAVPMYRLQCHWRLVCWGRQQWDQSIWCFKFSSLVSCLVSHPFELVLLIVSSSFYCIYIICTMFAYSHMKASSFKW